MSVKQASTEYSNTSLAFLKSTQEGRVMSNVVMAMAVEDGSRKVNDGATRTPLTDDQITFNYAMSGAGLLLLLIVIALAKGLYEWKYRRRRTNPTVPTTTRVTEAWSGGTKKTTTKEHFQDSTTKGKQLADKTNFNGRQVHLTPPVFPHQPATLTIHDSEEISFPISVPKSGKINIDTSRRESDTSKNNIGNFLTSIESQLEVPSSSDSSTKSFGKRR